MSQKYTVELRIRRESDGKEIVLGLDEGGIAKIPDKDGRDLGHFKLVAEGLPDPNDKEAIRDFSSCLAYCCIDDANLLPYCLAICGAGS